MGRTIVLRANEVQIFCFATSLPHAVAAMFLPPGKLLAELVREYLDFYALDYAASVMTAEARLEMEPMSREALVADVSKKLGNFDARGGSPLLGTLIELLFERGDGFAFAGGRAGAASSSGITAESGPLFSSSDVLQSKSSVPVRTLSSTAQTRERSPPGDDAEEVLVVEDVDELDSDSNIESSHSEADDDVYNY